MSLEPLPSSALDPEGAPRFGAFEGWLRHVDLSRRLGAGWRGKARRLRHHRRWVAGTLASSNTLVAFGVADAAYAVHAWALAVDMDVGRRLAGACWTGLPGFGLSWPGDAGEDAALACSLQDLRLRFVGAAEGGWLLSLHSRALHVEARLSPGGMAPLTAIVPAKNGDVVTTRRAPGFDVAGTVAVDGRRRSLDGGFGLFERADGLFARRATWRRGFASGRAAGGALLAFHVAEGLSDAPKNEHVLWVDGRPSALGPTRITGDAHRPMRTWRLTTSDGRLDLAFAPSARHREPRVLGPLPGAIDRVAGRFSGLVRALDGTAHRVEEMPGLLELADAVW
ncbi:MAG: hypothetical protein RL199_668 [Pseudomonadota bacterium]